MNRISQKDVIRVLIVDDHDLIRMGLTMLLQGQGNIDMVGEAESFTQALELGKHLHPDVILLDLHLPEGLVVDRILELREACPKTKILILTADEDHDIYRRALRQGAVGLLTKSQPKDVILKAIQCVNKGQLWIDRDMTASLFRDLCGRTDSKAKFIENDLTSPERAIALLAAQGLPTQKISTLLSISDKTVLNQLVHVYDKLGVSGQLELVIKAATLGLVLEKNQAEAAIA